MSNFWSARVEDGFNLLPNFGYAVLVLPLYGREGFGAEDFNRLVENDNFGQVDIDAMAEVVQQMVEAGYTTPQRVGIMGCSYGSYFVTQSLVRHPDLYRAAHSQCNLLDLIVEWKRGFVYVAAYLEGRDPYSDPAEFIADSPLYQVAQVETPLLLFHGEEDFLPVTLTENYYYLLEEQGTPTRMLKFEGEGHGLYLPQNQLYGAQEQISWFRRYIP
ncbi:MAG: prolyl oligopeptidase family serine peptidase [Chloroflexaceae bacterium]|nr:prolyl oligopeptidase family serine peptidase [Chloroflexaceae bacterium]